MTFNAVIKIVVKALSLILSRGLNQRQFCKLLDKIEAQYKNLLYSCDVLWFSRVAMLERVFDFQKEIQFA